LNRDRLAEAFLLIRSLAGRDGAERQGQNSHAGQALCNAVIRAVAAADRPLRACEIHSAAQELAGPPLSWNTVKDCLHTNARRSDSVIEG